MVHEDCQLGISEAEHVFLLGHCCTLPVLKLPFLDVGFKQSKPKTLLKLSEVRYLTEDLIQG